MTVLHFYRGYQAIDISIWRIKRTMADSFWLAACRPLLACVAVSLTAPINSLNRAYR